MSLVWEGLRPELQEGLTAYGFSIGQPRGRKGMRGSLSRNASSNMQLRESSTKKNLESVSVKLFILMELFEWV